MTQSANRSQDEIASSISAQDFSDLRFGMFIHFGLYSLVGRGEWSANRERFSGEELRNLRDQFSAESYDPDALCRKAQAAGMRYVVLTTMHHEGFRLYPTELSDLHIGNSHCKRDLVDETIEAARRYNLKIGLYHSLNNWYDQPDASDALESEAAHESFLDATFARLEELVGRYRPIDILWYDGWWPFDANGWRAELMNQRLRELCPGLLFNNRNGLDGDFGTPEGHISAPQPWRPWETCISANESWGYHKGDHSWKSLGDVVQLLASVAKQRGNLLLNFGLMGDGALPPQASDLFDQLAAWMTRNGAAIHDTEPFFYELRERTSAHRDDWLHHGPFTCSGNRLFLITRHWPGSFRLGGLECEVEKVSLLGSGETFPFRKEGDLLQLTLPESSPEPDGPAVLEFLCDRPPSIRLGGGMRVPRVAHPPYDPCPSDILL
ncbi:alpha-L-fucosidase [Puniceicoccus vermicola]|uniref:alpha-L-fucosidase n=1 Tax=Puniceicoccus vermicola TaxID=388746 RepID=A0A7X1E6C1_9BACT|nr:alpha-L-fucosidase [Puniceicoccus vermicola]MBC2602542.1 alpha-L-fucosidase [Puniceicoccus vermicola]